MSDLIERQAVIDILDDAVKDYIKEKDFDKAQGVAWVKVQKLPSVTTRQKVGRWEDYSAGWMCSNCGAIKLNDTNYCPNCGARMEV